MPCEIRITSVTGILPPSGGIEAASIQVAGTARDCPSGQVRLFIRCGSAATSREALVPIRPDGTWEHEERTTGPVDMYHRFVFMRGSIHGKDTKKFGDPPSVESPKRDYMLRGAQGRIVFVQTPYDTDVPLASEFAEFGRVTFGPFAMPGGMGSTSKSIEYCVGIDTAASRFHPASVAGLVVGAMGCFIFGLYLRAWLCERKAAA